MEIWITGKQYNMDDIRELFNVQTKSAAYHSEWLSSHVKRTECNVPTDELFVFTELIQILVQLNQ
jgi:hypothetical protein